MWEWDGDECSGVYFKFGSNCQGIASYNVADLDMGCVYFDIDDDDTISKSGEYIRY
jgi:hypothetical protein